MLTIDVDVPKLGLVKDCGVLEDIKSYYLSIRDKIVNENEQTKEDYQFIYNMNDDLMSTYLAYYAFIFGSLQGREDLPDELFADVNLNIVAMEQYSAKLKLNSNFVKRCIACLYEYFVGSDEKTIQKFDEYSNEIKKFFVKRRSVELFRKINYNPNIMKAIKVYYLSGTVDLPSVGIEDDSYEALEYYFYCAIYKGSLKEFKQHPIAFIRRMKSLDAEECRDRVKEMFDKLNESLYTLDDFYSIRRCNLSEATVLVEYVNHAQNELKAENYMRTLTNKLNNANNKKENNGN